MNWRFWYNLTLVHLYSNYQLNHNSVNVEEFTDQLIKKIMKFEYDSVEFNDNKLSI
jgi:hypothetical protein